MKLAPCLLSFALAATAGATATDEVELQLDPLVVQTEREAAPEFVITSVRAEDLPATTPQEMNDEAGLPPLMAVGSLEDDDKDAPRKLPKILVTGSRLSHNGSVR